jgi:predicted helicase
MASMIRAYEKQRKSFNDSVSGDLEQRKQAVDEFIDYDPKQIAWTVNLKLDLARDRNHKLDEEAKVESAYRPFTKCYWYSDRLLNERPLGARKLFPTPSHGNLVISSTGTGSQKEFSAVMTNVVPDYELISKAQVVPRFVYDAVEDESGKLELGKSDGEIIDGYRRRDAITDGILKTFRAAYGAKVSKEDIFYYVYGVLHSPEYRTRFAADLKKMLPRISLTKEGKDFWAFSEAGRGLAKWHLGYETVATWPVVEVHDQLPLDEWELYKVVKMTFGRPTAEQKGAGAKWDRSKIIYNSHVTITKIPLEAYEYVVNGKPAIEWVMERYQVSRDKDSGIVNDPNEWCKEHGQPKYIIELVERVIRVSIETVKIVKRLPGLNEGVDGGS